MRLHAAHQRARHALRRSGFDRGWSLACVQLGQVSLSTHLLHHAPCPTLVIPFKSLSSDGSLTEALPPAVAGDGHTVAAGEVSPRETGPDSSPAPRPSSAGAITRRMSIGGPPLARHHLFSSSSSPRLRPQIFVRSLCGKQGPSLWQARPQSAITSLQGRFQFAQRQIPKAHLHHHSSVDRDYRPIYFLSFEVLLNMSDGWLRKLVGLLGYLTLFIKENGKVVPSRPFWHRRGLSTQVFTQGHTLIVDSRPDVQAAQGRRGATRWR